MNQELLEEVLSCPTLPSLPAVAMRVIELTQNEDVRLPELAATIENDQALSAKILRTVNSSYYGLRKKCTTINQALVMLGLSAVKTLALGFSLVSSTQGEQDDPFDYMSYWRRGLYTGVAARAVLHALARDHEDEAFLGGLLQDVGQVAMYRALGNEYLIAMANANFQHRQIGRYEEEKFELQHPHVGAMLVKRWKLPDELVMPVRYHERPTAAPLEHADIVKAVGLGNIAHDAMTDADPLPALRKFRQQAKAWFDLDEAVVDQLLKDITRDTKELAQLFKLDAGDFKDPQQVLEQAQKQLVDLEKAGASSGVGTGDLGELVRDSGRIDALTGLLAPPQFDVEARAAFESVRGQSDPLSLLNIRIDGFDRLTANHGVSVGDEILLQATAVVRKHFAPIGGALFRSGNDAFAVLVRGLNQTATLKCAVEFRADLERLGKEWMLDETGLKAAITASIGTCVIEPEKLVFQRPEQWIGATAKAVEASRAAGGNCVRAFVPRVAA